MCDVYGMCVVDVKCMEWVDVFVCQLFSGEYNVIQEEGLYMQVVEG